MQEFAICRLLHGTEGYRLAGELYTHCVGDACHRDKLLGRAWQESEIFGGNDSFLEVSEGKEGKAYWCSREVVLKRVS